MGGSIPVPVSITESEMLNGTEIVWQWRRGNPESWKLAIMCVFWNVFLALMFLIFFHKSVEEPSSLPGMLFLLVPLGLLFVVNYSVIGSIVNRTVILVSSDSVEIQHRPIPWMGNMSIIRSHISQLSVREERAKDVYEDISRRYELQMIDSNGRKKPLIKGLQNHEALYLRNRLTEILGHHDRVPSGSYFG